MALTEKEAPRFSPKKLKKKFFLDKMNKCHWWTTIIKKYVITTPPRKCLSSIFLLNKPRWLNISECSFFRGRRQPFTRGITVLPIWNCILKNMLPFLKLLLKSFKVLLKFLTITHLLQWKPVSRVRYQIASLQITPPLQIPNSCEWDTYRLLDNSAHCIKTISSEIH